MCLCKWRPKPEICHWTMGSKINHLVVIIIIIIIGTTPIISIINLVYNANNYHDDTLL